MTDRWKVTIERWPYSGVDQKTAGDRVEVFEVTASDVYEALAKAKLYQLGILSGPAVWMAPIKKIEQVTP